MKHRVLNLGAGTQSSVLLVMADRGEIEPVEVAIFADVSEPREVYEHLEWLAGVPFTESAPGQWRAIPGDYVGGGVLKSTRVVVITKGDLRAEMLDKSHGRSFVPLYVLNPDGTQGTTFRKCTSEFKILPIERYIRKNILGLEKGEQWRGPDKVEQVFGISFDERHRCKNGNGDPPWMLRDYPLVDRKWTRWKVIAIAEKLFPGRTFPRSACPFCPYRDKQWQRIRDEKPEIWRNAVELDRSLREGDWAASKGLDGVPFLHRQMVPLDEADLRSDDEIQGQAMIDGFANECEGMCGV